MAKDTTAKTDIADEALPSTEQLAKDLGPVATVQTKFTHKHSLCGTDTRIDIRGVDPLGFCRYCNSWFPAAEFE